MTEAEPLQQIRRTYVRFRSRTLSYFGGCDYFRLASHPRVLRAVREGLRRYGLNVAASRTTTGHHEIYRKLEAELARFFGAESALLTATGYVTNLIVAQALAGRFSHALLDTGAHAALQDAALALNCPILQFKHRDPADFAKAVKRCGPGAKLIALTDGMFSRNGTTAPLRAYRKLLPRDGWLLVDDAHGAGTIGIHGRGTVETEGISRRNLIQSVTLSKAFGSYGGAILAARELRAQLLTSRMFIGSTPPPLPLACAALESLHRLRAEPELRENLARNFHLVKEAFEAAGWRDEAGPGPIIPLHPKTRAIRDRMSVKLLAAGILPPLIHYPGAPALGYFRFVISSEHTPKQLDALVRAVKPLIGSPGG
jgi:7-keto-8-aminopelargonate synthetase-like enzyme